MAVARINKLEVIGLQENKEKLLLLLQKLANVELINTEVAARGIIPLALPQEINLLEIEEAITYLASFQPEKSGLLKGMVKFKPLVYQEELKKVVADFDYQSLLKALAALRNHLKNLFQHQEKLIQEKQHLAPWKKLKIPLDEMGYTPSCGILSGISSRRDYANLTLDLEREKINLFYEAINQDQANVYLVILYVQEDFEKLESILKSHHFNFVTLSRHAGTVADRILEINRELLVLADQIEEAKDKVKALAKEQFQLMVIYDYWNNIRMRREAEKNLAPQQFTFSLSAWVKQKDIGLLEKEIAHNFKEMAVFISEPKADEDVPVVLENKRLIQPFEFITGIYGMPQYHELDPTPFLAPFFFFYFGFCVSDVGYGLLLTLFCFLALKKLRLGPQGRKFFRLFLYCGISTIAVGALTGSWFGNLLDLMAAGNKMFLPLQQFKDSLIVLDPMKEPTRLLGIALCLGIIQVWFGNIVAAVGNIKNRRYLDILFDQVPMLVLLFGLTGIGLIFLKLWQERLINLFKYAALAGGLALMATQGRAEKGLAGKIFYGIYNLYNALSGYLSDILSYSRLWALGLVTGVMAMTINLISIQFSQIFASLIPFIDKIGFAKTLVSGLILILIFVAGHTVSFLMNLLGAFVHPVRLQFVEFFSKFFKSGGSTFKPFKVETRYINIG